jgi:RNA 3'-terminal phosphate cyclase (ATP)
MIELDGNYGEGGGALLRVAMAMSTLTKKPFKIKNIRANRPKPGLKQQHLTGIKALIEISGAKVSTTEFGATELEFIPGEVKGGTYTIDIGTAGSITLLLQSLILPCMFGPSKVTLEIIGGTCGKWQAGVDYLQNLLLPHLEKFVSKISMSILKRGYYPKGGGKIILEISPKLKLKNYTNVNEFLKVLNEKVSKINLTEQGEIQQIKGIINLSENLTEMMIGERVVKSTKMMLEDLDVPTNIDIQVAQTHSSGGELLLWSVHSKKEGIDMENPIRLGGDALLEKGKSSQEVGKEAVNEVLQEIQNKACCDEHLTDQIIPFMALLNDSKIITSKISNHSKTNIYVIEQFLDVKFVIDENKNLVSVKNNLF